MIANLSKLLRDGSIAKGFALVFAIAAIVRVSFFLLWNAYLPIEFDAAELAKVAINLYEGRGFTSPWFPHEEPTAIFAPLIPALYSILMHIGGGPNADTARLITIINIVPSSLAVACYWLIARQLTLRASDLPGYFPVVVALVFSFWPESLFRFLDLWYYVWQEAAIAALVYSSFLWIDRQSIRNGLIIGTVAGVAAYINPVPLPVFAVALITPFVVNRKNQLGSRLRAGVIAGLVATTIIAPWTIRNMLVFDSFIPMRSGFGMELRQGNNPVGSIRQNSTSIHPSLKKEELEKLQSMGEPAYTQWASRQAKDYIRTHPSETLVRVAQRFYVTWFTDIFDQWSWFPEQQWWNQCCLSDRALRVTTILTALVPLVIVVGGLARGYLRGLPYIVIFISLFLFLPLPYYFTQANDVFSQFVRPWLGMLALIVVIRWIAERRNRPKALIDE
jgi:hypothetical protein